MTQETKFGFVGMLSPWVVVTAGLFFIECGWAAILLYHLLIVAALLRARYACGKLPRARDYLIMLTSVVILCIASPVLKMAAQGWQPDLGRFLEKVLAALHLSGVSWYLFILYYATVNPLLEELYWRGLLGEVRRSPTWGDAAFASYHMIVLYKMYCIGWPWPVAYFLIVAAIAFLALVLAALWCRKMAEHGDLRRPILWHMVADFCIVSFAHLLRA